MRTFRLYFLSRFQIYNPVMSAIVIITSLLSVYKMLFISFSCLISSTSTSGTILTGVVESGQPCLSLNLRGKAFKLSLLSRF